MEIQNWQNSTGSIKLFRQDCKELMKQYPDKFFDLGIVDPPYGNSSDAVNVKNQDVIKSKITNAAKRKDYIQFNNNDAPDEEYFLELKRVCKNTIIWGGNFFGLRGGVIAWNKFGTAFGEGEIAICTTHNSVRFFEYIWNGMLQQDMKNREVRIHATQKPVALYKYCFLNYAKQGFKILDTHLGSGSIACAVDELNKIEKMNLELIACEINDEIFNKSVIRIIEQSKKIYPDFFDSFVEKNNQPELFDTQ